MCYKQGGGGPAVALGAGMRKPLMMAYGVLKIRTPFDPKWGSIITA